MYANALGRIDPRPERSRVVPQSQLRAPRSQGGRDGDLWFTANGRALHWKTRSEDRQIYGVTSYRAAADPHTPIFDRKGSSCRFTVQRADKVGRLDPKTGDLKLVETPTPNALPYGMVVDTKGTPYYCAFGAPKIAAIDPATMKIKEWTLPNPGARPRRIAITDDDIIYYANYARGYLGRVGPEDGCNEGIPVA